MSANASAETATSNVDESILTRIARLGPDERARFLEPFELTLDQAMNTWPLMARPSQLAPPGAWTIWLFSAGRGAGKTRAASEWVSDKMENHYAKNGTGYRVALAGRTGPDARAIQVEGVSGLVKVAERRGYECYYMPSKREVHWPEFGAQAAVFSAEEPDQARGPEHHDLWADEIAAWDHSKTDAVGNNLWTNLQFGLRMGEHPQTVASTTPKQVKLVRQLFKRALDPTDDGVVLTTSSTMANAANLARSFLDEVYSAYAGTSLGIQELDGMLLMDVEGALWSTGMIVSSQLEVVQIDSPGWKPMLTDPIVGVDPPTGDSRDECGIVAVARIGNPLPIAPGRIPRPGAAVIADRSRLGSPEQWANAAVQLAYDIGARVIVAEANQGGKMVASVINNADVTGTLRCKLVHATVGKRLRAEPVSMLYEQKRVVHMEPMPDLEAQMTSWTPEDKDSPDRLDALVHAVAHHIPRLSHGPSSSAAPPSQVQIVRGPDALTGARHGTRKELGRGNGFNDLQVLRTRGRPGRKPMSMGGGL